MKKYRLALTVVVPVLGFLFTLLLISAYQHFKLKTDLATSIVKTLQQAEAREIHSFFTTIDQQLHLLRDWGMDGVLFTGDVTSFNKKMIPLLVQLPAVRGITVAGDKGNEYYLYRDGESFIQRTTRKTAKGSLQLFARWSKDGELKEKWQKTNQYNPETRPWYKGAGVDGRLFWTGVYKFFESGQAGITGSIAWTGKDGYFVAAIDLPLANFAEVLKTTMADRPGQLMLFDLNSGRYVKARTETDETGQGQKVEQVIPKLLDAWKNAGKPENELFYWGRGKARWLGTFHQMSQEHGELWLVLVAPESALVLGSGGGAMGVVELSLGLAGGLATFLLWRLVAARAGRRKKITPEQMLVELISQGESGGVEFKSTVRMNLKSGKQGREIEFAWLKAVTAFLNSDGGVLLLGVADDGKVIGLDADDFENEDRCLLHIKNLINQHIGAEFSGRIEPIPVQWDGKLVVMIECRKADQPVFLRIGKNEEFYVRSGPSSMKLSPSQTVNYVRTSEVE